MKDLVFLDTSAIYALADRNDANHEPAETTLAALLDRGVTLLTHSYILVESVALLQKRLGASVAIEFLDNAMQHFEIVWIDAIVHAAALEDLRGHPRRKVSFVDRVSFAVMRSKSLDLAFAFDEDFAREGFTLARP